MNPSVIHFVNVRLITLLMAGLCAPVLAESRSEKEQIEFFEKKIRPVFVQSCYKCHSNRAKELKGGLRLDSREGVHKGGESGPAIVPGKPKESLLIEALRYESLQMPPTNRLPDEIIADFEKWIESGAVDPRDRPDAITKGDAWPAILEARRDWWSLLPVERPPVPELLGDRSISAIDRFVCKKLAATGLSQNHRAAPRTLIRRLSLVLIGLPPSKTEIDRFLEAWDRDSDGAIESVVDRLLESPHFGERWARHWMDVVRYTETHGNEWNYEVHHAWRYRDYLIRAFNSDVPYDQLVREHIAGDLLTEPRWNEAEQINESLIGTAFYRFGEVNHDDCVSLTSIGYDILDNQIDTLTKAFQATTVACARCHDHKIDAVSMQDYYGLLGMLKSSRMTAHTIDADSVNADARHRLGELKPVIRAELGRHLRKQLADIDRYLLAGAAKIAKLPQAEEMARGLDAARVERWSKALDVEKPGIAHPVRPWSLMTASKSDDAAKRWKELTDEYTETHQSHSKFNKARFTAFADFRHRRDSSHNTNARISSVRTARPPANGWQASGQGLRSGFATGGDFTLAYEGDNVLASILPAGRYTHLLSQKLNGTLRSPLLAEAAGKHVSVQVLGERTSAFRLVSNNCQLNYANYRALTSASPAWVTFKVPDDAEALRTFAELVTRFDNPKFPDQLGTLGGDKTNDRIPWREAATNPHSYFGIIRAVIHDAADPPKPNLSPLMRLFENANEFLTRLEQTGNENSPFEVDRMRPAIAQRYASAIKSALQAWIDDKATDDDVYWLSWVVNNGLLDHSVQATPELAALVAEYRSNENRLRLPRLAPGLADSHDGRDHRVLHRGHYGSPGPLASRRYLEVLARPDQPFIPHGSGRRELAERIASADNPLTARVLVNRVWHHLFGSGIVKTVDDFGRVGERPSHPDLLDWLAARFVAPATEESQGLDWSIKNLIREIVLSNTFCASSRSSDTARLADPQNRLLLHYPARRLDAESIRDSILCVSGRLDRTLFGLSIDPFREKPNTDRRLFAGPLDGDGRRSVYIKINLMEGPKFLSAFNIPGGKIAQGRRDVTNVPGQALTLLNDPFVLQQSNEWSSRLIAEAVETDNAINRINSMFVAALGRPPETDELQRFTTMIDRLAELHQVPAKEILARKDVWKDVAHVMYNQKEFIYLP